MSFWSSAATVQAFRAKKASAERARPLRSSQPLLAVRRDTIITDAALDTMMLVSLTVWFMQPTWLQNYSVRRLAKIEKLGPFW
jgi:hypothetical protein